MKFETKKFSADTYQDDVAQGFTPVFRNDLDCENPRELHIEILPEYAKYTQRVTVVQRESGEVYRHSSDGSFNPTQLETCLDLVMRREIKNPKRVYRGMAYVHPSGKVVSVLASDIWGPVSADDLTPVNCTITLDAA